MVLSTGGGSTKGTDAVGLCDGVAGELGGAAGEPECDPMSGVAGHCAPRHVCCQPEAGRCCGVTCGRGPDQGLYLYLCLCMYNAESELVAVYADVSDGEPET